LKERSLNPTAKNSKTFSAAAVVGISVANLWQKERKKKEREGEGGRGRRGNKYSSESLTKNTSRD
jgi:hypothetical protein